MKNQWEKDDFNIGFRCSKINEKIINNIIGDKVSNENCGNNENCAYNLNENMKKYTPRFVHLHEIILYNINKKIAQGEIIGGIEYIKESICEYNEINGLDLNFQDLNLSINSTYQLEKLKELKLEELEELRKLKFIEILKCGRQRIPIPKCSARQERAFSIPPLPTSAERLTLPRHSEAPASCCWTCMTILNR